MAVRYPFGHGLSYTSFEYADPTVSVDDGGLTVRVTVTNTGNRAGREVVQAYASLAKSRVARAPRALVAFANVGLDAGESREVELRVRPEDLEFWDIRAKQWVLEGGDYRIDLGASSRDLRVSMTVSLHGNEPVVPLSFESTIGEMLANPVAGPKLREALQAPQFGAGGDNEMMDLMAGFPIGRLVNFPGAPATREQIEQLIVAANTAHERA